MDKVVQNHSCPPISYGSSKMNFVVIAFSCGGEIGIDQPPDLRLVLPFFAACLELKRPMALESIDGSPGRSSMHALTARLFETIVEPDASSILHVFLLSVL